MARTLAKQFGDALQAATAPYQFALQTRAGSDAMGHVLRAATEMDPEAVLLSLDGIGAYDHVQRAAFLRALRNSGELRPLLPFVRLTYARSSRYLCTSRSPSR